MSNSSGECQNINNMNLDELSISGFGFVSESPGNKVISIGAFNIGSNSMGDGADIDSMGSMMKFSPVFPLARFETSCGELLKLRTGGTYRVSFFAGTHILSDILNSVIDISGHPQPTLTLCADETHPIKVQLECGEKPDEDEIMAVELPDSSPDESYLDDETLAKMYPHHRPSQRLWYHNLLKSEDAANLKFKNEQAAIRAEMMATTGKLDFTKCDEYSIPGYIPEGMYDDETEF